MKCCGEVRVIDTSSRQGCAVRAWLGENRDEFVKDGEMGDGSDAE